MHRTLQVFWLGGFWGTLILSMNCQSNNPVDLQICTEEESCVVWEDPVIEAGKTLWWLDIHYRAHNEILRFFVCKDLNRSGKESVFGMVRTTFFINIIISIKMSSRILAKALLKLRFSLVNKLRRNYNNTETILINEGLYLELVFLDHHFYHPFSRFSPPSQLIFIFI